MCVCVCVCVFGTLGNMEYHFIAITASSTPTRNGRTLSIPICQIELFGI